MIILHAFYQKNSLYFWGEIQRGRQGKIKKQTKSNNIDAFPYAASSEDITEALKYINPEIEMLRKNAATFFGWFPAVNGKPVPSSSLIAEEVTMKNEKIDLSVWSVPTVTLSLADTITILTNYQHKNLLDAKILPGQDVIFWNGAITFVFQRIQNGHFLPDIVEKEGSFYAYWKPLFFKNDAIQLEALTKSMPHIARSFSSGTKQESIVSAQSTLNQFIKTILDYRIRKSLAEQFVEQKKSESKNYITVHDAWLAALKSEDGVIHADKQEVAMLDNQIKDWHRPISVVADAPFRLCFRINEPEQKMGKSNSSWHISYLLQAIDDQSLFIDVKDAWGGQSKNLKTIISKYAACNVQEYLLYALGQACQIAPCLTSSLQEKNPYSCTIDTGGMYSFLTQNVHALEQAGFGVMLPSGLHAQSNINLKAKVKTPAMKGQAGLSLADVLSFDFTVAIGNETVSFKELQALAKHKIPLIQMRGQWVLLDSEKIKKIADYWQHNDQKKLSVQEVLRISLTKSEVIGGLKFEDVSMSGWLNDVMKQLTKTKPYEKISPSLEFKGILRPYQEQGLSWLHFLKNVGLGACLADDMGLGKTIQTLALLQIDWQQHKDAPTLLVCPTSVLGNWQKETTRFAPDLPVTIHHGTARAKTSSFKNHIKNKAVIITSYALLYRDFELLNQTKWRGIILDEAQYIKNPFTRQARSIRSLKSDYRIALTGTPVENHLGDIWSIMEFLNPGYLGSQKTFKEQFVIPIQMHKDVDALQKLKSLTTPFILRRLKTDKTIINDLPEKFENKVFCHLTKEQASLYEAVVKEAILNLEDAQGIDRKGFILATLARLKQICNHPAQFLADNSSIEKRSGKLERLADMVKEVRQSNEKLLIFSQFVEMGKIIKSHMQENLCQEALFLHGGVTKKQRDMLVEQFQKEGDGPSIFILSLRAGGTGLNLTQANHVFHFDRWWNPAVENQATDRAFRIGQKKNVQVHKFICLGTLEEKIDEMIEKKKELSDTVVGASENWITELSNDALKDLFALRKTAIIE